MSDYNNKRRSEEILRASKMYKKMHTSGELNRTPVSGGNVLAYPTKEGMHRRLVEDRDGRLERFFKAGYTVVTAEDSCVRPHVGNTGSPGTPVNKMTGDGHRSYLMEIPQDQYDEYQRLKAAKERERELTMLRKPSNLKSDNPNHLAPDYGGMTIKYPNSAA